MKQRFPMKAHSPTKQLSLFPMANNLSVFIPGPGKRKTKRPLSSRSPIHLVLSSQQKNLSRHRQPIVRLWSKFAVKFGIKTYQIVVNHDHIHVILKLHSQKLYSQFIQAFTGTVTRLLKISWRCRPATRIASWGRDFKRLCEYVKLNFIEAAGFIDYRPERTVNLPRWLRL